MCICLCSLTCSILPRRFWYMMAPQATHAPVCVTSWLMTPGQNSVNKSKQPIVKNTSSSFEWYHSRFHRKYTAVRHNETILISAIYWDQGANQRHLLRPRDNFGLTPKTQHIRFFFFSIFFSTHLIFDRWSSNCRLESLREIFSSCNFWISVRYKIWK